MNSSSPTSNAQASGFMPWFIPRFLRELKRRWWIPLLSAGIFVALARFAAVDPEPASYTYAARMWVGGKIKLAESSMYHEEFQNYYGTQMELMQSKTIQRRAHDAVRRENPGFPETPVALTVTLAPRAALFTLTAIGPDPRYVEAFLNAVMDEYLNYRREVRSQSAEVTLASITEQLGRLEVDFNAAQTRLRAFLGTNSMVAVQEQGSGAGSYLAELNRKFADLRMQSHFLGMLASEQSLEGGLITGAGEQPNGAHAQAERELGRLNALRDDLMRYLRPKHPRMIQLTEDIHLQEELLRITLQQNREDLRKKQVAISIEMKNIESMIQEWEDRALSASARMAEYDHLKQDVDRVQRLYDQLLLTIRNVDVSRNLDQETIAPLERAEPVPISRVNVPREALGAAAGLLAGLGAIAVLMFINDKVATAEELEGRLTEPVIGQIPEVAKRTVASAPLLLEMGDARHSFAEALKGIRSALFYSNVDGNRPKSLLVTSAIPGEGKSTVAANVALAFAFSGYRVLLVEGDFRCGVLNKLFNLSNEPGLADLLGRRAAESEVIVSTSTPNLSFIPAGQAANPSELFLSEATDVFIRGMYQRFDYIIFDSVPVLAADDTTSLAPKVDGVVFVVRSSFTSARLAKSALDLLHSRQARILGVICNRCQATRVGYGYEKLYRKAG